MQTCNVWINNPYYHTKGNSLAKWNRQRQFRVPCGKCPQCLALKQSVITDLSNYEWNKRCNGVATFLTLTYDDEHIEHLLRTDKNGAPILSLYKKDYVNFMKRFRRYLEYHNLYDDKVCKNDFKYLVCGEYGDRFHRPHFHMVLFGIHPNIANDVIRHLWTFGFIKALELKDGGIRYVTKYMQKQTSTKANISMYDDNNIERPFFYHSVKLGQGLLDLQNVSKNNFRYKVGNREVPLPYYYRTKFFRTTPMVDSKNTFKTIKSMKAINKDTNRFTYRGYTEDEITEYLNEQRNIQNEQLVVKMRQSGETYYEDLPDSDKMLDKKYHNYSEKELTKMLNDVNLSLDSVESD